MAWLVFTDVPHCKTNVGGFTPFMAKLHNFEEKESGVGMGTWQECPMTRKSALCGKQITVASHIQKNATNSTQDCCVVEHFIQHFVAREIVQIGQMVVVGEVGSKFGQLFNLPMAEAYSKKKTKLLC